MESRHRMCGTESPNQGDDLLFPSNKLARMDTMAIIEARMTKHGGLDFETNLEWLLTSLVDTAVHSRLEFFQSMIDDHDLSSKRMNEELFGVNIPLLRLIANGQIFNPSFLHPMEKLEEINAEIPHCQNLLDQWMQRADKVQAWGNLTLMNDQRRFPSRSFSFSQNEKFGKVKDYSHPRLHPTRNQRRAGDVRLFIPSTGCLPMGSFCGTYGYGLIHPNIINASVVQLSFASTHSNPITNWPTSMDPQPTKAPEQIRAAFDMMSVAPNFDLQLEASVDTRCMHYCCINGSRYGCDYGSTSHVVGVIQIME